MISTIKLKCEESIITTQVYFEINERRCSSSTDWERNNAGIDFNPDSKLMVLQFPLRCIHSIKIVGVDIVSIIVSMF